MFIATHFSMNTPFFWNSIPLEILRITKSVKVVTWPFCISMYVCNREHVPFVISLSFGNVI